MSRVRLGWLRRALALTIPVVLVVLLVSVVSAMGGRERSSASPLHRASPSASPAAVAVPPPSAPSAPSVAPAPPAAPVVHPAAPSAPGIDKVIRIATVATPAAAQAATDACRGPVEYQWGPVPPIVVEHNYCGGTAMVAVTTGQTVQIIGGGLDGLYKVAGRHYVSSTGRMDQFQPSWGNVILTSCVDNGQEAAVGLTRIG